jgi:hypothetical protein
MTESDPRPTLILGNGPSLDALDPALLPHFYSMGSNHIHRKFHVWGRPTDAVVITDSDRLDEVKDAYRDYSGELYIGDQRYVSPPVACIRKLVGRDFIPLRQLKKETLERIRILDRIKWSKYLYQTIFHKGQMSFDLKRGLNFGYSVVVAAIQLAAIRGCSTILMTGVDAGYQKGRDYFAGMDGAARPINSHFTSNPRLFMEPMLALAQVYLEEMGVSLIDCTPGGNLRFVTKGELINSPPYYRVTKLL